MFAVVACATLFLLQAHASGPGSGPWSVASPESHGLSTEKLTTAASRVNAAVADRSCYLVVKNGDIVHEEYYRGSAESTKNYAWSCTKSMCASLYGIAVQQGWANVDDLVRDRNKDTRRCNPEATFRHVLTMTGESSDLNNPTFNYDGGGEICLDAVVDFIEENNPESLGAFAWMRKYYYEPLGFEHDLTWGEDFRRRDFSCGWGVDTSCRDLARAAQLWVTDGVWGGSGQLVDGKYSQEGQTFVFPQSGPEYGYLGWLAVEQPAYGFIGHTRQCAWVSKEQNAIVISMGPGAIDRGAAGCEEVWEMSADAVHSERLANHTRS